MDTDAIVKTYGNPNLSEGTPDRPLVTFAVFAYNQEKYIREAVEGAFSQTHSPLEIILSDDCSSDRTFEIMEEMAKAYEGPHKIVVVRNNANLGTVDHVISVSRRARGKYLVVAAGDDISASQRTTTLVQELVITQAAVVYSSHHEIDESGKILRHHTSINTGLPGFSAAYKTSFWAQLPYCRKLIFAEDALAHLFIKISGYSVSNVDEPLVYYRISASSQTLRSKFKAKTPIWEMEEKIVRAAKERMARVQYVIRHGDYCFNEIDPYIMIDVLELWRASYVIARFWSMTPMERWGAFAISDGITRRYMLPRLGGRRLFSLVHKFLH